jgi:hypothetical protein
MKKGVMGIRTIIAIVGLSVAATTTQAGTNSWTYTGANVNNYHWDATGSWSLGAAPTISDTSDFITNTLTKAVAINASDAFLNQAELTISNLTVSGTGGTINTLALTNMNAGALVPLHVLSGLTIGTGGVLVITNSMLQVDGALLVNGTMQLNNRSTVHVTNATFNSSAIMTFTLGTNTNTVVVAQNLTLGGTLNVISGGGFTNTTYTLFTYGGIFTSNTVTIGTVPANSSCSIDSSVAGQVNLVVGITSSSSSTASVQLISIVRNASDMAITWSAPGGSTSLVQGTSGAIDGSYTSNNFADIPSSQLIAPGTGIFTNTYTDVGGATNVPSHFYRIHYFQ